MSVTLLMPVINELEGLREIMPHVDRGLITQVLVIDGGSTDGSFEYSKSRGWDVIRQSGKGVRQAYLDAFPHIKGEIVISFSPDGNSDVARLGPLVDKMREGYDMVIVSRYTDGAKSQDDTAMTAFGNWAFTFLVRLLGNCRITDAMVIYRAYRKELIPRLRLNNLRSPWWEKHVGRYVGWEPQLSIRSACRGVRLGEIPGDEPPRIAGITRIHHYRVALSCFYAVVQDWIQWKLFAARTVEQGVRAGVAQTSTKGGELHAAD